MPARHLARDDRQLLDRACIGTREDHHLRIVARVDRGAQLLHHLRRRDHVFAVEVPAALREGLVLEHHRARARTLQQPHRTAHVHRVAEAGVRIHDDRQVHRIADRRHVVDELGDRGQPHVGLAQVPVGDRRAAHEHRLEAGRRDEAGAERIARAGQDRARAGRHQRLQPSVQGVVHRVVSSGAVRPRRCRGPLCYPGSVPSCLACGRVKSAAKPSGPRPAVCCTHGGLLVFRHRST